MDNIKASNKIFSIDDAKKLSKKRLPKLVYDFIDGASGDEKFKLFVIATGSAPTQLTFLADSATAAIVPL